MDVKASSKPILSSPVHADWWEGSCRVGSMEGGTPEFERRVRKEQFKIWYEELQNNLDPTHCSLMGPIYMGLDEGFVMWDSELDKLVLENYQANLYLTIYRVSGVEHLNKPVSATNLGPTPIDLVGYYRDIGLKAYMAHDYEEYNHILICPQVHKAVASAKILILSNSEQTPVSINTSCYDPVSLFTRYGIRHNRTDFRQVLNYFDEVPVDEGIHQEARALAKGADKVDITEEYLCSDLRYLHAVRRMMERYDCNAFTTPYKELCASRLLQKNKCVSCIIHPLNKDDRISSACEGDLAVQMAMMMVMYLTRQSVSMGNPVLVLAGNRTLEQLGMPKLLTQPGQASDHDVLGIHYTVSVRRTCGSDRLEQKYELAHFTTQGWDAHYHVDMVEEEGQAVTLDRFSRQGTRMIVAVGHTLGCEFRPVYCSPVVYHEIEGGARELRQALAKGGYGHHRATIHGNHVKELQELGEIVGFEVEVSH